MCLRNYHCDYCPASSRPGKQSGFTLLELIIVLVIAAAMMSIVPPMISSALPGTQLKSASRQIAAGLNYARNHALTSGKESTLVLDLEKKTFVVSGRGKTYDLPGDLALKLFTAESEMLSEEVGGIRFFPDGGSTGGRITLSSGQRAYAVDVDWLTGRVRILDAEPADI